MLQLLIHPFQELRDQEKHIEQLRSAVRAKGQPLKVAQVPFLHGNYNPYHSSSVIYGLKPLKNHFQARLAMRQRLPGDEACLDLAHVMLIEEVDHWMAIETFFFKTELRFSSGSIGQIEDGLLRFFWFGWLVRMVG